MLTDRRREEENTGIQDSAPYGEEYDIQSDFVMVYGLGNDMPGRIRQYREKGYIVHLMTGVSWGNYSDYLNGEFDGRNHWDEAQKDQNGEYVLHGPEVPYMIPSNSFADYLIEKIKPAIDEGISTIHMEEPEIWVFSGYSDAMKREYKLYYREDWVEPRTSVDAYYKTAKLKNYLYTRMLDRVAGDLKEYAMVKYGTVLRFIVPTHSLISYFQYGIVSPESALMDANSIDGYIAQIWTGTSRVRNVFHGVLAERVFESSFLEYGIMQELVRGTERKMWLLQDPIEDDPNHTWEFYQNAYLQGLTAALLQPKLHQYEVCPWPRRVWQREYPKKEGGIRLPKSYETILLSTTQVLRDMDQPYEWLGGDAGVGVLLADSSMYQRNYAEGVEVKNPYSEKGEENKFSGFFGLTLPLLKRGIHVLPVQLDNVRRFHGYLADYNVLVLSYEFMKPEQPDLHYALALWVEQGGCLVVVGDDSDDFHAVRHWWNAGGYNTPSEHLLETLGLDRKAEGGVYAVGKGFVAVLRKHPAALAYNGADADAYAEWIKELMTRVGMPVREKNYFALRRGPYVIAQVMEDGSGEDFVLEGTFVDLYDENLKILNGLHLHPGENKLAADLARYDRDFCLVGSAGRVENFTANEERASFIVKGPSGSICALRFKSPQPKTISGSLIENSYDAQSGTLLLRMEGRPEGISVEICF